MLVVDSTAVLAALAPERPDERLTQRLGRAEGLHAPDIVGLEVIVALDQLVKQGSLTAERAEYAQTDFAVLRLRRYPTEILAAQIWELRDHLNPFDAAFVALARTLDMPLITCDPVLAAASQHVVEVELVGGA